MTHRRAWTERFNNDPDIDPGRTDYGITITTKPVKPAKVTVKKRKAIEVPDETLDRSKPDLVLEQPPTDAPLLQRPNAVRTDGGPILLQGLVLPWPPSANRYWKDFLMVKKGTKFPLTIYGFKDLYKHIRHMSAPSPDAEAYKKTIRYLAMEKRFRFMTTRDLRIDILVCPPDRRGRDHHNYDKVLLDALQDAGVYEDDEQIKVRNTALGPVIKEGKLIVSLREITHDPDALFREVRG